MARVSIISEERLGDRTDAAKAHVWKWLASSERELMDVQVRKTGPNQYEIRPDDPETVAKVTFFVQELAELIAEFSAFPHPPEA